MALIDIWDKIKTYKLNSPQALDLFMRQNLAQANPKNLFLTPFLLPVYIANPSGSSPIINWYDRNPLVVWLQYSGFGPIVPTDVFTYIVPPKRRAYLENYFGSVLRSAVAAPVGIAQVAIQYAPAGGTTSALFNPRMLTNAIGDSQSITIGQSVLLQEGDVIIGSVQDGSTGGTTSLTLTCKLTEFDA